MPVKPIKILLKLRYSRQYNLHSEHNDSDLMTTIDRHSLRVQRAKNKVYDPRLTTSDTQRAARRPRR
ncbi:hypothetical protein BDR03DRAFT_53087 [Suillus americanus]|nr:hypothetical protein BDR03DRAFT_53087 [Suillus americanus]